MNDAIDTIEAADRASRRRARLLPLFGIALIIANAILSDAPGSWPRALGWAAIFAGGLLLVLSGGVWPGPLSPLINDETTRMHRLRATSIGYTATVCCALGLSIAAMIGPFAARQAIQIILATAIGAPLISFGTMERTALDAG